MSSLQRPAASVLGASAAVSLAALMVFKQLQRRRMAMAERRCADWQQGLVDRAAAQVKEMGLEVLSAADEEEAVAVQSRSFIGSANTQPELAYDWRLGLELREKWDDPLRIAYIKHAMLYCFRNTIVNGGIAIGARAADGRLGAVCLACPMIGEDGSRGDYLENRVDVPPLPDFDEAKYGKCLKLIKLRAKWHGNLLHSLQDEFAPGPHWYILVMAVDPKAQGQGLAGRVMRAVNTLADKAGVPCFLDTCGERNRSIYERVGYKHCGGRGFELNVPGDPAPMKDPTMDTGIIRHFGMVRAVIG